MRKVDKRGDNLSRIYAMILKRTQEMIEAYHISYADVCREMYRDFANPKSGRSNHGYVSRVLHGDRIASMSYLMRISDAVEKLCGKMQKGINSIQELLND